MPDRMDSGSTERLEALRRELSSARTLLQAQKDLDAAVRAGAPADRLWPLVRAQEAAAVEAAQAARDRARWIQGAGSLEAFLAGRPAAETAAFGRLASEAAQLRSEIRHTARRTEYVARRTVEWTQAQCDSIVRLVTRRAATYEAPGARGAEWHSASFMDKSA